MSVIYGYSIHNLWCRRYWWEEVWKHCGLCFGSVFAAIFKCDGWIDCFRWWTLPYGHWHKFWVTCSSRGRNQVCKVLS